uniref:Probable inactive serine/threonine-protein kinase bub1 n=1 Tax=Crassostrea virginica TaxID=6565 RepID=A0A8B8BZX5_CRAVI|nr:probable inactive serine/threonine-protein kinase bub1 [Crassostrea virginica]
MAAIGRGKTRTKQATKQDIAERVQEIQMRQKNWMEQREEAMKQKVKAGTKLSSAEKSSAPKDTKHSLSMSNAIVSSNRLPKERFQSWLAARDKKEGEDVDDPEKEEEEDDIDILKVSSSRTPGYASPEPEWEEGKGNYKDYQQSLIMSQMMSAEDFEAKADTILSRVKCGLDTRDNSSSNNNNNNKNSNSGNSDLSSHYCPVCRNLMKGEQHSPLIYVPCGHNACISCSKGRELCPCCGSQASSKTRNIMLMQIIEDYQKGLHNMKKEAQTSEVSNNLEKMPKRNRGINKTKYREEYENLKMRQDVLNTEIRDIQGEINSYVKEISDGERQISKIQQEEKKVIGQIQSLQDKLHSLEQHRAQYERECECTRQAQKETREKLHQTQDILLTVEIQMEKARLLAEQ